MKKIVWGIAVVFLVSLLVAKPLPLKNQTNAPVKGGAGFFGVPDIRAFHDRIGKMLEDEFNNFDNMFSMPQLPAGNVQTFTFSTDVYEQGNYLVVKCDLPGMDKKDIKIYIDKGNLVIEGQRKSEVSNKDAKKKYFYQERTFGSFYRAFSLPTYVKTDSISASFKNGVLTVKIPIDKTKKPHRKYVEIK